MNVLRFRLFRACAALLVALLPVTTAFAAKPEVFTIHEEGVFEIDCGSFVAVEEFEQDIRVTTFFNDAGDPVRVQVHFNYSGVITNPVTGNSFRDPGHFTLIQDLEAGTQAFVGVVFAITVPGKGIAVRDAGRLVFLGEGLPENVIFEGGSHQTLHEGEAVICAALD